MLSPQKEHKIFLIVWYVSHTSPYALDVVIGAQNHSMVVYMKLRIAIIVGLIAAFLIAPALAAERVSLDFPQTHENHKVTVTLEKVVEKDTSDVYPPQNFPPSLYKFVTLHYSLYNPTDSEIRYDFNISIMDQNGHVFEATNFLIAERVPAHGSLQNRYKEYAIYRNSTQYQFVWHDKEKEAPWNYFTTYINVSFAEPTPEPTVIATPYVTAKPSPTPEPVGKCLPFLPLGMVVGGFGGLGLLSRKYLNNRR